MILQDNKILLLFVFSSESWEEKCGNQRTLECFREGRALESISAGPTDELLVQDLDVLGSLSSGQCGEIPHLLVALCFAHDFRA